MSGVKNGNGREGGGEDGERAGELEGRRIGEKGRGGWRMA